MLKFVCTGAGDALGPGCRTQPRDRRTRTECPPSIGTSKAPPHIATLPMLSNVVLYIIEKNYYQKIYRTTSYTTSAQRPHNVAQRFTTFLSSEMSAQRTPQHHTQRHTQRPHNVRTTSTQRLHNVPRAAYGRLLKKINGFEGQGGLPESRDRAQGPAQRPHNVPKKPYTTSAQRHTQRPHNVCTTSAQRSAGPSRADFPGKAWF